MKADESGQPAHGWRLVRVLLRPYTWAVLGAFAWHGIRNMISKKGT